jgi:PBP1b-binding outer membrane lipoprotein LpoB
VSRRAVVTAGLSAVAIVASGCSGDSDTTQAESPPATTTEQVDFSRFRAAFKARFDTHVVVRPNQRDEDVFREARDHSGP